MPLLIAEEIIELFNKIESLRAKMIAIGLKEGLTSKNTISISQELDKLIAIYQTLVK